MNKKNTRKGFTIVELIIVIAVIAILAAVLIPTFGTVIDKANQSAALQEAKIAHTEDLSVLDGQASNFLKEKYFTKTTDTAIAEVKDYYTIANGVAAKVVTPAVADIANYYESNCQGTFDGQAYTIVIDDYTVKYDGSEWTVEE